MITDFHTHVDEAEAFGWIDPPEKILGLLDEAGIERAVIMTYTDLPGLNPGALEYIVGAANQYPDRLIPFLRVNPNHPRVMPELLERALAAGVRGLKVHPTTTLAHPAAEPTLEVLRLAARSGVPVLFHCGDDPYTTPQTLELAAQQVPDCNIVLGHMGGYFHVTDAIEAAIRQPNLYLETSAMPYPEMIRQAVDQVGADRVIFGSDGPGCNPRLELAKITSIGLPTEQERLVLGGNAERLLGGTAA
ncbi:amidohydrolase family protein [Lysinimonas soli]|uniref:Amidohydrolase family protein n=1 Tax=Lysinimonas soli TaxID=1074233 RepID=A0ABW0NVC3_9MICO